MELVVAALECERDIREVVSADVRQRVHLIRTMQGLPPEFFGSIRHFQPQVGCLGGCAFCSQSAGRAVWHLTERALRNVIAALKTVSLTAAAKATDEQGRAYLECKSSSLTARGVFSDDFVMPPFGLISYQRIERPGVIYCYLDDDPSAYPYLDKLCEYLYTDLGVQARISTIGFSRHNVRLVDMHNRVAEAFTKSLSDFRVSVSPYPVGWRAEGSDHYSKREYIRDVAHVIRVYKGALDNCNASGRLTVELRFPPLLVQEEVIWTRVRQHLVVRCGPHVVVGRKPETLRRAAAVVNAASHELELSVPCEEVWFVTGERACIDGLKSELVDRAIGDEAFAEWCSEKGLSAVTAGAVRVANGDGKYLCVMPLWTEYGFYAKYFYPKTAARKGGGFIDAERYFLNEVLRVKRKHGCGRRSKFANATWLNADEVVGGLKERGRMWGRYLPETERYISRVVIPMAVGLIQILKEAKLGANALFDPEMVVDSGQICNLGRAWREFVPLASRPNLPITLQHERAYGVTSDLAREGKVWRLSVLPCGPSAIASERVRGTRNRGSLYCGIQITELDLAATSTIQGQDRRVFQIGMLGVEQRLNGGNGEIPEVPGARTC